MQLIEALEALGKEANLQSREKIEETLMRTGIESHDIEAIIEQPERMFELVADIPEIKCFFIVPAEDDDQGDGKENQDEKQESNALAVAI